MNRTQLLLTVRPEIKTVLVNDLISNEEHFQNNTIRPIIKFQHDLIISIIKHSLEKHSNNFFELSIEKQLIKTEEFFKSDNLLKKDLIGIIKGLFTLEEYETYHPIKNEMNKRIIQIIKKRFLSIL